MPAGVTVAIWQGLKATKSLARMIRCASTTPRSTPRWRWGPTSRPPHAGRGQRGRPPIVRPFYEGERQCHYQAQKVEAFAADVLFVSHEGLFQLPPGVCDGFGLVIIDESFWQKGLSGAREGRPPAARDRRAQRGT